MRGRRRLALLLFALLARPAAAEDPACGAPPELLQAPPLPVVAGAVLTGRLHVLAVGSASITSPGVSGEAATFAARLRSAIAAHWSDIDIRIDVRGQRGSTVAEQWRMIQAALRDGRPDLVIWQAGTVEAVRGLPVDAMAELMSDALAQLHARGIDVVVMDFQFSRFLRANADIAPYAAALRLAASAGRAALFPRYALMQAWVEAGTVDVERTPRAERIAAADRLNDCLARAMAAFLRHGVREAGR